jgi:cellulose synthase/poly-beta-1,6-N-acetylglucosamine synthase-like glycosyltransferase
MLAVEIVFWACVALLVHTHVTYPLSLALLVRLRGARDAGPVRGGPELPMVSLIVAAHDEEGVIERRVGNALKSDYPRERLEVIVTSDGSEDRTVALAESAGADLVLDLSRRGKVEAQNAAVERARGEVLAFSDANSFWRPDALRRLVERLADPEVGYVCGQVSFFDERGENQEGAYWRYEMAVRNLESGLAGVTAGNGAIYAVRAAAYVEMPSDRGHDLCLPYLMVRRGLRAVYEPAARAEEPMAPTMSGEWQRKRRMMNRTWGVLLHDRMLSPRGYGPLYAYEMLSHRALRYASPFLHLIALAANVALLGEGPVYAITLGLQAAFLVAAALGRVIPLWPLRIASYYVSVTASIVAGLIDRIRSGPATTWEPVEGTR